MTGTTPERGARGQLTLAGDNRLLELSRASAFTVFQRVGSSPRGLTEAEAEERLRQFGENEPFRPLDEGLLARVVTALRSPFVALLAGLSVLFVLVGDTGGALTVAMMVMLAVVLRIWQQTRSARAARSLRQLVTMTVTVRRRIDADAEPRARELPFADLVPGDVVVLHACDVVPADMRILTSTGLLIDESVLSGESLPAAKSAITPQA